MGRCRVVTVIHGFLHGGFLWWQREFYGLLFDFTSFFFGLSEWMSECSAFAKASRDLGHGVPLVAPAAKAQSSSCPGVWV